MLLSEIAKVILWSCIFIIFYAYILYPLSVFLISLYIKRPHRKREQYPSVSLIIPFYNEEEIIREKIENVRNLIYPRDKLEIIFVSDGSKDNSPKLIKESGDKKIILIELEEHRGKAQAINEGVKNSQGEILIFSDISGIINKEAVKYIVENFYDEDVGAVLGIYRIIERHATSIDWAEERYWDFELILKRRESLIWTTLGGHGALYAIRKELFESLPPETINDDFIVPAKISLRGKRTVYEERAILHDKIKTGFIEELRRRIRIAFGNWQQIIILKAFLTLRHPFLFWQFFSHKILRAFQGILLMIPFLIGFLMKGTTKFVVSGLGLGFLLFSLLGILGYRRRRLKLFYIFTLVLIGIVANLIGTLKFIFKRGLSW